MEPATATAEETPRPTAEAPTHELELTVRGYHLDLFGQVNNARYLESLEEARWAWFEQRTDLARVLGGSEAMVIVRLEIDYRYPAGMGDRLLISSRMGEVGNRSVVIRQEIRLANSGTPVVDANVTVVIVDAAGKATPIQGPNRQFFATLG